MTYNQQQSAKILLADKQYWDDWLIGAQTQDAINNGHDYVNKVINYRSYLMTIADSQIEEAV